MPLVTTAGRVACTVVPSEMLWLTRSGVPLTCAATLASGLGLWCAVPETSSWLTGQQLGRIDFFKIMERGERGRETRERRKRGGYAAPCCGSIRCYSLDGRPEFLV